jgi:hypothetical protein
MLISLCVCTVDILLLIFVHLYPMNRRSTENRTTDGQQGTLTNIFIYNLPVHLNFVP